jgi:competence protein ComEC
MLKDLKIFKIFTTVFWIGLGVYSYRVENYNQRVVIFDIGQGDSILIQKGNYEILVDGGADDSVVYKMGEYMKWNDRLIDVVVITHMHDDHYMGIKYLMERYDIGLFLLSPNCEGVCEEFKNGEYIEVSRGMKIDYEDIQMDILWPEVGELDDNLNNDSIVLLLNYLNKRILLMGDAEKEVEQILLKNYREDLTDIDVLKASHHCSNTSSIYEFIELTNPSIAVCSCGEDNRFGHPNKETIDTFNMLNIPYHITWEDGDYIVKY